MNELKSSETLKFAGNIVVPGDKSTSHRALMFGAMAIGETTVSGLLEGEDVMHTADAMRAMGARVNKNNDGSWSIHGVGLGGLHEAQEPIYLGNSGTSARLLMGLVSTQPMTTRFTGDASLSKRPMKRVMDPLSQMGVSFKACEGGTFPLSVTGPDFTLPIEYRLPVASAQVKSAILLAGLNTRGTTTVIEEKPTRTNTETMLGDFGVQVTTKTLADGARAISLVGGQEFKPCHIDVPADPSSAAFPAVAAALIDGADITLPNVGFSETRNGVFLMLKQLGADISFDNARTQGGEPVVDIRVKGGASLKGFDVPQEIVPSMIDEFPIFAIAAACAHGTTYMSGLEELRVKESDRLLMMAEGLAACGVSLEMGEDTLTIHGTGHPPKGGAMIKTALDHRIAMSFLVLGAVSEEPISVDDAQPIETSFPKFTDIMNEAGMKISR